jgi:hypothetical protein
MSAGGTISYEDRIKKVFKNAYIVREKNSYAGPIWFKYAVFCGENRYCKDTLLGLGMDEEKAWLDAFYGFKFLKVHLGMEKKKEGVTAGCIIREEVERNLVKKEVEIELKSEREEKGESGVGEELFQSLKELQELAVIERNPIAMIIEDLEELCIHIESDLIFEEKLHLRKRVQCDSFVKTGRNNWIQCECFASVKVGIEYPKKVQGIVELYLCPDCFTKSDNGKVKITVMEHV